MVNCCFNLSNLFAESLSIISGGLTGLLLKSIALFKCMESVPFMSLEICSNSRVKLVVVYLNNAEAGAEVEAQIRLTSAAKPSSVLLKKCICVPKFIELCTH